MSDDATALGVTINPIPGTVVFPTSVDAPWMVEVDGQITMDTTPALGLANGTALFVYLRGSSLGDIVIGTGYLTDTTKQTSLSITAKVSLSVPSAETLSLGISTAGNTGNIAYINSQFRLNFVDFA